MDIKKLFANRFHNYIGISIVLIIVVVILLTQIKISRLFALTVLNGLTLSALYFLVASGFTLVFGLMRIVNLAHGSLFLLGGYVGYSFGLVTGSWTIALIAGFISASIAGVFLQKFIFSKMLGQDLRQTLITIGISIILADIFLWVWGGDTYQFDAPQWLTGVVSLPLVHKYSLFRLVILGISCFIGIIIWILLNRTRLGMMIRAGVDDKKMLSSIGVNVEFLFIITFAIGAGLAGFAGVAGGTVLSISPGEDVRYLLASLVVVLVGGIGSIVGAALGALLIGLTETFGQVYAPTYGIVFTFVIMVFVLAFRPSGLLGKKQ